MRLIKRREYIEWLERWRDKDVIKVVSGVRRCGKSTLLSMFRQHLENDEGITSTIAINFEDIDAEPLTDYHALNNHIIKRLTPNTRNYIFLDEIQHVAHFEKVIDNLYIQGDCDIYITGSNAYLMSSELGTLLTGRYIELAMLPLSFAEFLDGRGFNAHDPNTGSLDSLFNEYMRIGSLPYLVALANDETTASEYLRDVYASILLKDVVSRLNIPDVSALERVSKTLASSIGSYISTRKITDTLKSQGRSIDQRTVDRYLDGLTKSLLYYEVPLWDIKGRKLLTRNSKFYMVDTGIRNTLVAGSASDLGHLLENIVYLELKRSGYEVYVGSFRNGEIDFVAQKNRETHYFQVAASVMDQSVLERELAPFAMINDNYPKTLLTLDRIIPTADFNGIKVINVVNWLYGIHRSAT